MNELRVMTFNLRGSSYANDAPNLWQRRADLNLRTIHKYAPDLIGFQELQDGNLETYRQELTGYESLLGTPSNEIGSYNYNSIYWNPERLRLVDSGGMFLSESPDTWSKSWDSVFVRSVNWVRLRLKDEGHEFLHFNTHLDHVGVQARVQGSRLIVQKARLISGEMLPILVTGDFNSVPWLPDSGSLEGAGFEDHGYYEFRSNGFRDAFLEGGQVDTSSSHTFHAWEGERFNELIHGMAQRIDWILLKDGVTPIRTAQCQIIRDAEPPIYPSDHYPVLALLQLGG